jgi:hypothetical protein
MQTIDEVKDGRDEVIKDATSKQFSGICNSAGCRLII